MNLSLTDNLLYLSDSYKFSHYRQYPPGTEALYSYFESRGGKFDEITFFGLQYLLKQYFEGEVITKAKIDEVAEDMKFHFFGDDKLFNRAGWEYIVEKHGGRLPIEIKAVPEGSVVPTHNVLLTIENTDPNCYWLTNFLETLSVQTWYPTTVGTISYHAKKIIAAYLEQTGTMEGLPFKFHDFGFRGVSSVESAAIGGAAHLVNFMGTDTVIALKLLRLAYGGLIGHSIPAAEHSTITSWGRLKEVAAYENMLDQFPTGLVAVVSDSYDIYNACKIWGGELKDKVLARDGTVVVRPDSGPPPAVILKILKILGDSFGYEKNKKGYKVLPPQLRIIQGDGVDLDMLQNILATMAIAGWSADNIAFGCGGGLLQKLDRDTQKFAFKASSVRINGEERDVYKDPITDPGKKSKRGRLVLIKDPVKGLLTQRENDMNRKYDLLRPVFRNGKILYNEDIFTIRGRANGWFEERYVG